MWSLLGCCLLGFFLATGTCLECETCFNAGHNCTGIRKTCAAGEDTCIIILEQAHQYPVTTTFVSKGCGASSDCNVGVRQVDFGNRLGVRVDMTCCTGDACETTPAPALPPPVILANGLQCPGCLGLFSADCDPSPVACTGSSAHCIELSGQVKLGMWSMDVSMKGCANDAICYNLKAGHHSFGGAISDLSVAKCTPASGFFKLAP